MKIFLLSTCLLLAVPAAAETVSESTGLNTATGAAPSTADFVNEVAISDMFEIKSSQLAATKGDSATKSFAEHMVADHGKTSTELKSLIASGQVKATPPADMDSSHKAMLDKLQGLGGKDFVAQYDSDQVSAHKSAIDVFKRYANGGENAALKAWAAKTLPTLQHHLQMAQSNYEKT